MIAETKSFKFFSEAEYLILKLYCDVDAPSLANFEKTFGEEHAKGSKHMIVNCESMPNLSPKWLRCLLEVQNKLQKTHTKVVLILVPFELKQYLKLQGLDTAFITAPTLREALPLLGLSSKKKMDTDFINPFLEATLKVLSVQGGVVAEPGKFFVKKAEDHAVGDVSGIIGIVSEAFNGAVIISFPEKTFLNVMSGMLGEKVDILSKDILDGAGEITNMIFGQAKIALNEKGYGIKMALPSVVSGKDHSLSSMTKGSILVIPFKSSAGDFFVEICLSA